MDVSSFGDTREEARVAIQEALELYFEDAPDAEVVEVAEVYSASRSSWQAV